MILTNFNVRVSGPFARYDLEITDGAVGVMLPYLRRDLASIDDALEAFLVCFPDTPREIINEMRDQLVRQTHIAAGVRDNPEVQHHLPEVKVKIGGYQFFMRRCPCGFAVAER